MSKEMLEYVVRTCSKDRQENKNAAPDHKKKTLYAYMTASNIDTDISIVAVFHQLKNAQEYMRADAEDTANVVGVDISNIQLFEEAVIGPMSWHIYTGGMDGDFFYGCIQEIPEPLDKEDA